MAERITDYRKYLDPLSSEYIEPGINPRASYTSGYSGPVGEMQSPRSENLYNAGATLSNYGLPGIGGALRNVGAGMRLEPANYARSALEGLSLVPGAQPMTTAARIAGPAKQFGNAYARQQSSPYNPIIASRRKNEELYNILYGAKRGADLARRGFVLHELGFDPAQRATQVEDNQRLMR